MVEGKPIRPGSASRRPEPLLWLSQKMAGIASLTSRERKVSVSVAEMGTEAFPLHLPHRLNATVLVTYAKPGVADRAEEEIREALAGPGPQWDLDLIADRPPLNDRRANRRLFDQLAAVAQKWEIPLATESSVWPSVAGLARSGTPVICGVGPQARDLHTPGEAVQRISLVQRTLLLSQFLLDGTEQGHG